MGWPFCPSDIFCSPLDNFRIKPSLFFFDAALMPSFHVSTAVEQA